MQMKSLPEGSLQVKNINGHEYRYLVFRKNNKVVSQYIKPQELEEIIKKLHQANTLREREKMIREYMNGMEKAVGRKELSDIILKSAISEIKDKYAIEKIILFGSRATNSFRDDSDYDLLVSFSGNVGMMTIAALLNDLEERLPVSVDLLTYPLPENSMVEVNEQEVVYES